MEKDVLAWFKGKVGLEIGGPSRPFMRLHFCPIYPLAERLDNCNFSDYTVWEGPVTAGDTYRYDPDRPLGRQYIAEATDLSQIPSETYDFVLSSHTLEHVANPLLALSEFLRVLRPEGALVLILPHKDETFDHRRPVTRLAHLIADFENGVTERDLTHLPEILELHDLAMDPPAGSSAQFKARSELNWENRCLHHHVFDTALVASLIDYLKLQIVALETADTFHIAVVAHKTPAGRPAQNAAYLGPDAAWRVLSPFASDWSSGRRSTLAVPQGPKDDRNGLMPIRLVSATRVSRDAFSQTLLGQFLERVGNRSPIRSTIEYENTAGLPAVYNRAIAPCNRDEILVFVHDDVWIDDWFVWTHLNQAMEVFDLVGVVGNKRRLPRQPSWAFRTAELDWDDAANLSGAVGTLFQERAAVSWFSNRTREPCRLLDGLFLAAPCSRLLDAGVTFDERFDFHFYDLDFCRSCEAAGLRIGTWPVAVTHASGGDFRSASWRSAHEEYLRKWETPSCSCVEAR